MHDALNWHFVVARFLKCAVSLFDYMHEIFEPSASIACTGCSGSASWVAEELLKHPELYRFMLTVPEGENRTSEIFGCCILQSLPWVLPL